MSWKILVVDDDRNLCAALSAVVRLIYRDLLPDEDVRLTLLADGSEAVEYCRRETPDLVIMDVRMPGLDGIEAFSRLSSDGGRKTPRTAFLTGYSGHGDVKNRLNRAVSNGALGYYSKPVTRKDLERFILRHHLVP